MSSFDEREKSFEKKFVRDEELQFKVNAKRNKYLGEWAADKLGKVDDNKVAYIKEVIKAILLSKAEIKVKMINNVIRVSKFLSNLSLTGK